jgi:hypothetical protein
MTVVLFVQNLLEENDSSRKFPHMSQLPLHKRVAQVKSKCRKTDISSWSAQEILSQTPFCLNKTDSCFTEEYGVTGHFMFLSDSDTILMGKDAKFCLLFLPER